MIFFFSKFAKLYNHHNNPVLKHFHHLNEILHTLLQLLDITTARALATSNLPSASIDLSISLFVFIFGCTGSSLLHTGIL